VIVATGLAASQSQHICVRAIERSTGVFCQYFHELQKEPLNPVERVVFSLVLARAKAHQDCKPPIHS